MWLLLTSALAATTIQIDVGRGDVPVEIPDNLNPAVPAPLIVSLHGYSGDGPSHEALMRFSRLVDSEGFVYTYPTGEPDIFGFNHWNATDYCCGTPRAGNDVQYLTDVLDAIEAMVSIDPRRVYFIGHSNGGFMSYRMACEMSDRIAAVASLAGATWDDPADCNATSPVSVLQIHGTNDTVIRFDGDCAFGNCYPSVQNTLMQWYDINQCSGGPVRGPDQDYDLWIGGDETQVFGTDACAGGGSVALWRMVNSTHVPIPTNAFAEGIVEHFYAHPKP